MSFVFHLSFCFLIGFVVSSALQWLHAVVTKLIVTCHHVWLLYASLALLLLRCIFCFLLHFQCISWNFPQELWHVLCDQQPLHLWSWYLFIVNMSWNGFTDPWNWLLRDPYERLLLPFAPSPVDVTQSCWFHS